MYRPIYEEDYVTANCLELHIFTISGTNSNPHEFYKSAQKDLHIVYQIFFHHTVDSTFFAYLFLLTSLEKKEYSLRTNPQKCYSTKN